MAGEEEGSWLGVAVFLLVLVGGPSKSILTPQPGALDREVGI